MFEKIKSEQYIDLEDRLSNKKVYVFIDAANLERSVKGYVC